MKPYFNCRMRTKFVQTLADYQVELKGLKTRYEFEKAEPLQDVDDEFIDVTGDDLAEQEQKIIKNLTQPPSKIYYDNIEKEPSDGGFFDRDDLEDEDDKNDLIIDCKLNNGETVEKKTESENCRKLEEKSNSSTTGPELVFNFTVVDTQLVYNDPKNIRQKQCDQNDLQREVSNKPVVSIQTSPARKALPVGSSHSLLAAKLKEFRVHPYTKTSLSHGNRISRTAEHRARLPARIQKDVFYRIQPSNQPIGSRFRPSAFSPPAKANVMPQSVQLKPSIRQSTKSSHFPLPQVFRKPSKKLHRHFPQDQQSVSHTSFNQYSPFQSPIDKRQVTERVVLAPDVQKSTRYLPPQFGFGTAALHNLYDPKKPLDFSKNSLLSQYENMLKYPQQQQLRQGHSILRSMPLPAPPDPPKGTHRPKVVPLKQHPTLCPIILSPSTENQNSCPKPTACSETPLPLTESFRKHMNLEIEKFFTRRQNEIFQALRLYAVENITLDDLFRRLEHFQIRFSRDYNGLALTMVQRYGYRMRSEATKIQLSYRFKEPPQSFVEYFRSVKDSLRPLVSDETLNIYRIVIGSLLEQFRDSLEYFLSRCLH
ncbi:uncharacterized protein LOC134226211 isoform X2 [Armigeres subalbatus]|uniref:uncharacterized protein LOC134226211 isoform X2 n=1 Tax=Armigeres subalbatus TaxID=124917 RepID=UPI002ED3FB91